MPVELKEVIEFLGYKPEEIKTIDDLKASFDKEFVRAKNINEDHEIVKPFLGKQFGVLENEAKKAAKTLGLEIDFEADDFKALKKVSEKWNYVIKKLADTKDASINELKTNAGKGVDEKIKGWETKYDKLKKEKEDSDGLLKSTSEEFVAFKDASANQIKGVKLSVLKKDAFGKIKFRPDISEIEKKGFNSVVEEKYNFDADENDALIVTDKKGNKIPNPKVTGTFKTAEDILQEEAIAGKLYVLNQDGGKKKPEQLNFGNQQPGKQIPVREVAPRMK